MRSENASQGWAWEPGFKSFVNPWSRKIGESVEDARARVDASRRAAIKVRVAANPTPAEWDAMVERWKASR